MHHAGVDRWPEISSTGEVGLGLRLQGLSIPRSSATADSTWGTRLEFFMQVVKGYLSKLGFQALHSIHEIGLAALPIAPCAEHPC